MHVAPAEIASRPRWVRWLLGRQRRRFGDTLLPARVWARVPPLYAALERKASPLPPVLRSLVQVRVSELNDCAFCVDLNAALAAERAGAGDQALAVAGWRDDPRFGADERLALA